MYAVQENALQTYEFNRSMAEPTTTGTVGLTSLFGFSAIGVLSSAHPTAIWGALIGAFIYILATPEHKPLKKLVYLFTAWAFGYYIALEFISRKLVETEGAIAGLASALCLPVAFGAISIIRSGEAWKAIKRLLPGGRNNDS